ncbi:HD domain-containing phosphohydrolase [uncultured Ferrimonas sp.]|uniref:HD-GYP domain-containing protein n=1 Tax=uncultured Ferrimonas sp. TaxID=432640 RepID=UPI0026171FD6|nr:HD domain-containing phosphohydrolase [uncultured Ferrimonas sp.]
MKKLMPLYQLIASEGGAEQTLTAAYQWLHQQYPLLSRFCVASVEKDEVYNFFVRDRFQGRHSEDVYQSQMALSPTLAQISKAQGFAHLSDLHRIDSGNERISTMRARGHRSSFTFAIKTDEKLLGFMFFNSSEVGYFDSPAIQDEFIQIAQLLAQVKLYFNWRVNTLDTALSLTLNMGHDRDPETQEHLERMTAYSVLIAQYLAEDHKVTNSDVITVRRYARYHDIGKYRIQDDILFSSERFTPEQRQVMNQHCQFGCDIISNVEQQMGVDNPKLLKRLKNIILHHHERYDGKGYPYGLAANDIPIEARIITVADVFDALLSERKYKPAWPLADACQFMREHSGTMFDPDCVDALLAQLDKVAKIRTRFVDRCD